MVLVDIIFFFSFCLVLYKCIIGAREKENKTQRKPFYLYVNITLFGSTFHFIKIHHVCKREITKELDAGQTMPCHADHQLFIFVKIDLHRPV